MDRLADFVTSARFIGSLSLIIITMILVLLLNHTYKKYAEGKDLSDVKTTAFVRSIFRTIKYVILFIAVFALLQINGLNISSIVAGVGVVGAVVGLAMQDLIKDIIMGFHIVNDHAFAVGDAIRYNGDEGIVTSFTLVSTQMESVDTGDIVTICNRNFTQVSLACGMYDIDLPLSYEDDKGHIAEVLTEVCEKIHAVRGISKASYLGIQRYDEYAIVYKIRFWCSPKNKWPLWRAAMTEVQKGLDDGGIEMPYRKIEVMNGTEGK